MELHLVPTGKPHQAVSRKEGRPPSSPFPSADMASNPLMGFKVLLGEINLAEMLSWGQRWRPAPTPLVDNGPQSLSLGCTLGIKYVFILHIQESHSSSWEKRNARQVVKCSMGKSLWRHGLVLLKCPQMPQNLLVLSTGEAVLPERFAW